MANEQRSFKRLDFSGVVPGSLLQTIVIDIVCPYMVYQFLTTRMSALEALLLVALFPLAGIVTDFMRLRRLDLIGVGIVFVIICLLAGSLVQGDTLPLLLLCYALPGGILGIVGLLSFLCPQPLLFFVDRYFSAYSNPALLAEYTTYWRDEPTYRHMIRVMNTVWSIVPLLIPLLLVGLLLSVSAGLYLMLLPFAAILPYIILVVWTMQYKGAHMPIVKDARTQKES